MIVIGSTSKRCRSTILYVAWKFFNEGLKNKIFCSFGEQCSKTYYSMKNLSKDCSSKRPDANKI
jgi:hypothetical protein